MAYASETSVKKKMWPKWVSIVSIVVIVIVVHIVSSSKIYPISGQFLCGNCIGVAYPEAKYLDYD